MLRRRSLSGAVLVAMGLITGASAVPTGASTGTLVALSERIAVSPSGHRISEFAVAADPNDPDHLLAAAMDHDDASGTVACVTYVSRDGGLTWAQGGSISGLDATHARGDPWPAIDDLGQGHITCLELSSLTGSPGAVLKHARSDDGGDVWGPAARMPVRNDANSVDKESVFGDSAGRLYMCTTESGTPSIDLVISRSLDHGDTWSEPYSAGFGDLYGAGAFGQCNGLAEGPDGEVYLAWGGLGGTLGAEDHPLGRCCAWGTMVTRDGGDTWEPPVIVGMTPTNPLLSRPDEAPARYALMPYAAGPAIAVHPATGTVFFSMAEWDSALDRWVTHLYRSDDAGRTFSETDAPVIASCAGCHQTRPLVTVDAAGRLGWQVTLVPEGGLQRETWFTASTDSGASWLEPLMVGAAGPVGSYADPRNWVPSGAPQIAGAVAANPDDAGATLYSAAFTYARNDHIRWGGDYWWITSSSRGFVAMWIDHADGGVPQLWARIVGVELRAGQRPGTILWATTVFPRCTSDVGWVTSHTSTRAMSSGAAAG